MFIHSLITLLLIVFITISKTVYAGEGSGQYGQYGGSTPSYSIVIDKMVAEPSATKGGQQKYVDNLSPSDPRFKPQDLVNFRIKVKNSSSTTLKDVKIIDTLPSYVIAIEGPGPYDPKTHSISYVYSEIKPQEEKISYITVKIKNQEELPADKGLMCQLNKVVAEAQNVKDEDTAQYCLEKQVVTSEGKPPVKTPDAGAELYILLGGALSALGTGYLLKKAQ